MHVLVENHILKSVEGIILGLQLCFLEFKFTFGHFVLADELVFLRQTYLLQNLL